MREPADGMNAEHPGPQLTMPKETGWYFLPSVSSTLFAAGALGGGDKLLLGLNLLMLALALVSLIRPTVVAWAYLMAGSIVYLGILLRMIESLSVFEWGLFTVLGLAPTMALWSIRPRRGRVAA